MKRLIPFIAILLCPLYGLFSQTTPVASHYKHVRLNMNGHGPYTRALVLLHPIYGGVELANNYVVGHVVARRGSATALNRLDVAYINSSSAYRTTAANVVSSNATNHPWVLKTCTYDGVKYIAIDIPYSNAQHTQGIEFTGWALSSGESLKHVIYDRNGVPENTEQLTDIQDYVPNMNVTQSLRNFNIMGNVGIGTDSPNERLSVNGNIRAKEIKVEVSNWPDYVFEKEYDLLSLQELAIYIDHHGHLPEIPKASDIESKGLSLGEMNKLLLKKVEELTLHLINKDKMLDDVLSRLDKLEAGGDYQGVPETCDL